MAKGDFSFEIEEEIGVLSTAKNGWTTELNMVSWNGAKAKYDLRKWSPDHERCGKGITLTDEDIVMLAGILDDIIDGSGD